MLTEMTGHITSKQRIMEELATTVGLALNADQTNLYLVECEGRITLYRSDLQQAQRSVLFLSIKFDSFEVKVRVVESK